LLPLGEKECVPLFVNGLPLMVEDDPLVGSTHFAVTGPANWFMRTVNDCAEPCEK
jgi:hypothetical protein